jgi:hypothetical protein
LDNVLICRRFAMYASDLRVGDLWEAITKQKQKANSAISGGRRRTEETFLKIVHFKTFSAKLRGNENSLSGEYTRV